MSNEVITDSKREVPNYENLQVQCVFGLAEKINESKLYVSADISTEEREQIIEELGTIERDPSSLKKLTIVKKAKIKENINRSPDWRDLMLMRKYFDYVESLGASFRFSK